MKPEHYLTKSIRKMKPLKYIVPLFVFAIAAMAVACENNSDNEGQISEQELTEAKQELREDVNERIDAIEADLRELRDESNDASQEVQADIDMEIAKLKRDKEELEEKLDEMSDSTAEEFGVIKRDIEAFLDDVGRETQQAIDNIRAELSGGEEEE